MSRLSELIDELCPEGVEYKKIGEICDIARGKVISKDDIRDNGGEYPVYSSQTENDGVLGKISTYMYDGEYLTWTTDGANAGSIFHRIGKFNITNVCGLLNVKDNKTLAIRYLYYALQITAKSYVNQGMGNPKLMSNVMASIEIPVPPLPIQEEIVRILDKYTALEKELEEKLEAELEARKQQYEYYRKKLLTFKEGVELKKLGDVANINRGVRVVKSQLDEFGKYPVYQNSLTPLGYYYKNNCSANTAFVICGGAAGEIGYSDVDFWAADDCFYLTSNILESRYLYHVLLYNQYYLRSKVRKASIPRLSRIILEKLEIPIPPLAEQQRIVSILDKLEKSTSDLTKEILEEKEARRQQYEYYRDKLLTFKRKEMVEA